MHVSLNWLKKHIDFDLSTEELSEILTAIGLEVEGVSTFETVKGGLKGVVCGLVKTCVQHPNADRLRLTTVNVGGDTDLGIVCGAPNVAAGQHVWVATEGTKLYTKEGDEFTIKKSSIRGEESNGMICAEDELGIGASHEGILVLPESVAPGSLASEYYEVTQDTVYEIGLTPNRSDATHHRGVAEDLAAYLSVNGYTFSLKDNTFDLESITGAKGKNPVTVKVINPEKCPRYAGICIDNLTIGQSPAWLRNLLLSIGVRPINNVVDITNFILHDIGQPLHAFERKAISGDTILVQTLAADTLFVSLDDVERKLLAEDLMICDGESNPLCIAGVFGGKGSGVSSDTTSIFLESAHFAPVSVRVSSMKHNLRTDAAKIFEKGSDPSIVLSGLKQAAALMLDLAGGSIASEITDILNNPPQAATLPVRVSKIDAVIGQALGKEKICEILTALNMQPKEVDADTLHVTIPTNKADVTREVDVIEEILRIYGFNQVEMSETIAIPLIASTYPSPATLRNTVAKTLIGSGFNEMMGLSLIESKYASDFAKESLVHIHNTSNIHLDVMRPSMCMSGLVSVQHNLNYQNTTLRLFEFGKTYAMQGEEYVETEKLSIFLSGNSQTENWNQASKAVDYYTVKSVAERVLTVLGVDTYQQTAIEESIELEYGLQLGRGPMQIGRFGKVNGDLLAKMSIKQDVYYAEFDLATLFKLYKSGNITFANISKYPSVKRDLALVVDEAVDYQQIEVIIRKEAKKELISTGLFDVYRHPEQLGAGKKSYAVSMTFGKEDSTFTDQEVDKLMDGIIKAMVSKLNAVVRK